MPKELSPFATTREIWKEASESGFIYIIYIEGKRTGLEYSVVFIGIPRKRIADIRDTKEDNGQNSLLTRQVLLF